MPHSLLIGTVIFFVVIMALAMGIPFAYYLKRDYQQHPDSHRSH